MKHHLALVAIFFVFLTLPANSQEFIGQQSPVWCQEALREKFPSTPVAGTLDGATFKFKQAELIPLPRLDQYQLKIEGETLPGANKPRVYFELLTNDVEGKSFNVPHQLKKTGGIFYGDANFYVNDNSYNLYSHEYCARIVFLKKRPDGLIPGYVAFRAQSKLKKWKNSSVIGFFYARQASGK
jgi:hypothetical protein